MARKRSINPEIWGDPSFNKLSHDARLLFIGMFSNADDQGYIRGDVGSIKRMVMGFDDISSDQMATWIGELSAIMKNVHFYESGNETYAHFVKWGVHQKQQKERIQVTTYPLCSKCLAPAKQVLKEVSVVSGVSKRDNEPEFNNTDDDASLKEKASPTDDELLDAASELLPSKRRFP